MDHIWVARNSVRADFGKLIGTYFFSLLTCPLGEVKSIITDLMNLKPQTIEEFRELARTRNFLVG